MAASEANLPSFCSTPNAATEMESKAVGEDRRSWLPLSCARRKCPHRLDVRMRALFLLYGSMDLSGVMIRCDGGIGIGDLVAKRLSSYFVCRKMRKSGGVTSERAQYLRDPCRMKTSLMQCPSYSLLAHHMCHCTSSGLCCQFWQRQFCAGAKSQTLLTGGMKATQCNPQLLESPQTMPRAWQCSCCTLLAHHFGH